MKKHLHSFARYGGFAAMGFEWSALLLFYLRAPEYFTGQHAVSFFATLPQTRLIFTLFYLGAAFSFWIFAKYYLNKHYTIPIKIFAFSMLTFVGLALFPYNPTDTVSFVVHNALAQSSFLSFYAGMILMARFGDDKMFRAITYCAVALSAVIMSGFLFSPKTSKLILAFELSAWFICQVWTIWVSVRAYKKATV